MSIIKLEELDNFLKGLHDQGKIVLIPIDDNNPPKHHRTILTEPRTIGFTYQFKTPLNDTIYTIVWHVNMSTLYINDNVFIYFVEMEEKSTHPSLDNALYFYGIVGQESPVLYLEIPKT
ncbi:hypothetical protein YerA41_133 [Yersinia phage YerA41]|nr:hypothetical protein YerA41_133 [Yersinia phage YerA41]